MGKIVDAIIIRLIIFVGVTIISLFAIKSTAAAIAISALITIIISICLHAIEKKKKVKAMKLKKFNTYMIVYGFDRIAEIIEKIFPNTERKNGYMIAEQSYVIVPNYKFSKVGKDDIIKAYRLSLTENVNDIYIIGIEIDREALLFSSTLSGKKFYFIPSKVFYKAVKANDLLPKCELDVKSEKIKLRDILGIFFSKSNAKRYLFAAIILLLLGFLTPLKTYYLIISGVTLILAVISLFSKTSGENANKYGIFGKYQLSDNEKDLLQDDDTSDNTTNDEINIEDNDGKNING